MLKSVLKNTINSIMGEIFPHVSLCYPYKKFCKTVLSKKVSESVRNSLSNYDDQLKKISTDNFASLNDFKTAATDFSKNLQNSLKSYEKIINTRINDISTYFELKEQIRGSLSSIQKGSAPNSDFSSKHLKEILADSTSGHFKFKYPSLKDFQDVMCKCIGYTLKKMESEDFDLRQLGVDLEKFIESYKKELDSKSYTKLEKMATASEETIGKKQQNIGTIIKNHLNDKKDNHSYPGVEGLDDILKVAKNYFGKAEKSKNIVSFIENADMYLKWYKVVEDLNKDTKAIEKTLSDYSDFEKKRKELFEKYKSYDDTLKHISDTSDKSEINKLKTEINNFFNSLKAVQNSHSTKNMAELEKQSQNIQKLIGNIEAKNKSNAEISKLKEEISSMLKQLESKCEEYRNYSFESNQLSNFINSVNQLKKKFSNIKEEAKKIKDLKSNATTFTNKIPEMDKLIESLKQEYEEIKKLNSEKQTLEQVIQSTLDNIKTRLTNIESSSEDDNEKKKKIKELKNQYEKCNKQLKQYTTKKRTSHTICIGSKLTTATKNTSTTLKKSIENLNKLNDTANELLMNISNM